MKVLISSKKAIKKAKEDGFCWTKKGELLYLGAVCDDSCSCGCGRSFSGTESLKATTVAEVFEMDAVEAVEKYLKGMEKGGWTKLIDKTTLTDDFNHLSKAISEIEVGKLVRVFATPNSFQVFVI